MYKFLAKRIRDGYMTIDEVGTKFRDAVRKAYYSEYGEELK